MKTIRIQTGNPYSIYVEKGALEEIPALMDALCGQRRPKLAIITDDIVDPLYAAPLQQRLQQAGYAVCRFAFPHGEASKTQATVGRVYAFLSENNITRADMVVAVGGGVVGDLAGFAAATWLRGIPFVQVPTTFLAMIDSSVGGKTGVDLPQGKNLIGAFWQPSMVVCDPRALDTLAPETFADGTAEAVKYGAILDEALFCLLERGELQSRLEEVICRCIELKRLLVEGDERDKGERQKLNFGHTLGHAIEKESRFSITHGQGVAMGMVLMARACEAQGISPAGTTGRIRACCARYGLPVEQPYPIHPLAAHCMGDKKRAGSSLTLVTLDRIGQAALYPIEASSLEAFVEEADKCPQ